MTWQAASGAPVELSHGHAGAAGLPQDGGIAVRALVDGRRCPPGRSTISRSACAAAGVPDAARVQDVLIAPQAQVVRRLRPDRALARPACDGGGPITAPASPASIKPNTATPAYPPSMPCLPRWPARPAAVTLATGSTPAVCQSPTVIGALAGRVPVAAYWCACGPAGLASRERRSALSAPRPVGLTWKQPPPATGHPAVGRSVVFAAGQVSPARLARWPACGDDLPADRRQHGQRAWLRRGAAMTRPGMDCPQWATVVGLGSQGGGLRNAQRAGQLPGVCRCAPLAGCGCRGSVARRGLRVRARDRTGVPARRFLFRY